MDPRSSHLMMGSGSNFTICFCLSFGTWLIIGLKSFSRYSVETFRSRFTGTSLSSVSVEITARDFGFDFELLHFFSLRDKGSTSDFTVVSNLSSILTEDFDFTLTLDEALCSDLSLTFLFFDSVEDFGVVLFTVILSTRDDDAFSDLIETDSLYLSVFVFAGTSEFDLTMSSLDFAGTSEFGFNLGSFDFFGSGELLFSAVVVGVLFSSASFGFLRCSESDLEVDFSLLDIFGIRKLLSMLITDFFSDLSNPVPLTPNFIVSLELKCILLVDFISDLIASDLSSLDFFGTFKLLSDLCTNFFSLEILSLSVLDSFGTLELLSTLHTDLFSNLFVSLSVLDSFGTLELCSTLHTDFFSDLFVFYRFSILLALLSFGLRYTPISFLL